MSDILKQSYIYVEKTQIQKDRNNYQKSETATEKQHEHEV